MLPLPRLSGDVLRTLREHLRPLIAYHLFFTLLASSLLLPAVGWTLSGLLAQFGRPVITNNELIELLMSPGGLLWLLAAVGLTFLVLYLQQSGMILVAVRPRDHHVRLAFEALWATLRRLPAISGLVVLQVGAQLLLMVPLALSLAWLHAFFLGGLDPYFVQNVRPPALWAFLGSGLVPILIWILLAGSLYVRWHLALPALTLEGLSPPAALARSVQLTRGRGHQIAVAVVILLLGIIALPLLATALFDWIVTPLLWGLPERNAVLVPAMLAYLTAYLLIALAITFAGIAANALQATCLYLHLAHREPRPEPPPPGTHPGRLAWVVELAVVLFAIGQAWLIVNRFEIRDEVAIIAHRGSSLKAPENTMAAVEQAIRDRSDGIEIDVRLTADSEVVLYHDETLRRLAGDNRRVGNLTRSELAEVDVGSWFGDSFIDEPIPGLDEVLATVRGRANLMIELKPDPGRELELVEAVLDDLEAEREIRLACRHRAEDRVTALACGDPDIMREMFFAAMSPWLLREATLREPRLRTSLLAQLVMSGSLERQGFDALALRHNRIDEEEIRLAGYYDYELHAWTINDRTRMSQLIDLGVDAIITDRPAMLAELIAERRRLGDGALLLVKLRNWLRN
ncbi:glycerophosphodiester phosphodiesterase family protein [Halomonas daqiaonensis]|uniref:Glycerophosphoryl diester phosphodiesterase n=1 Tax=Halomonas daqiaonensis TaxID=650850 RepID=A0A1H7FZQ0_9GAMM|nr:glycerophosphodiester phosphodiesterase family protein [Halomonas daqiaonensis]SEK31409.1 glycerophosphoryl diester phosphodiesterase [Halomonas daqiaonensis]